MNQLIALGYAMRGSEKTLADLMKDGQTVLADIRDNPICTWSERWNPPALREAYPGRYWPLHELGNANHADPAAGIRLNDPVRGIALLVKALKATPGDHLVRLCQLRGVPPAPCGGTGRQGWREGYLAC